MHNQSNRTPPTGMPRQTPKMDRSALYGQKPPRTEMPQQKPVTDEEEVRKPSALARLLKRIGLTVLLVLNRWVLGNVVFTGAALLMFLLPPPYVIPVFADEPAERVEISAALSALTLVSLILFTVLCVFIGI